jgi:hypothetical protein
VENPSANWGRILNGGTGRQDYTYTPWIQEGLDEQRFTFLIALEPRPVSTLFSISSRVSVRAGLVCTAFNILHSSRELLLIIIPTASDNSALGHARALVWVDAQ